MNREHALLKYNNGRFLIFDNESKFGTLILLKEDYRIKDEKAAIQIGRTVFTSVLKYAKQISPTIQNNSSTIKEERKEGGIDTEKESPYMQNMPSSKHSSDRS